MKRILAVAAVLLMGKPAHAERPPRDFRVVHVFVALCDNDHQGIVKVSKTLGDGKDPEHNLYWGAGYGVKTFFQRSPDWTEVPVSAPAAPILRRAVFVSKKLAPPVYVVADAYDGERMDTALNDFLNAAAGKRTTKITVGKVTFDAASGADLVAWVGHDALMDLTVKAPVHVPGTVHPDGAIVLACLSQKYFTPPLRAAGVEPLVATTNFMAPEAYSLEAAIRSWGAGEDGKKMRVAAGKAYAQYQKISDGSGIGLFATGFAK
jgi:hypothetical protein